MTREKFYALLEELKKRPGMYIGGKSVIHLAHFLDGIGYALFDLAEQNSDTDFLLGFQEWIQIKYDIPSSQHWSRILLFFSANEEDAFDSFYKQLEEFLALPREVRDYTNILATKEKWLALRAQYRKEVGRIWIENDRG